MVSGTSTEVVGTIELISMWVAPFARGRGVGAALIDAVIGWSREQQARKLVLSVVDENEHAIKLYRRHRFVDGGAIDRTNSESAAERRMVHDLSTAGA